MIVDLAQLARRIEEGTKSLNDTLKDVYSTSQHVLNLEKLYQTEEDLHVTRTRENPKELGANEQVREATLRALCATQGLELYTKRQELSAFKTVLSCKENGMAELKMLLKIAELERIQP
jgi:hypothetical protein